MFKIMVYNNYFLVDSIKHNMLINYMIYCVICNIKQYRTMFDDDSQLYDIWLYNIYDHTINIDP